MNLLTETQVRETLGVSRTLFQQSLRPLFVLRGEAVQVGSGPRSSWAYDPKRLGEWVEYLAVRRELIRRGVWAAKRPYDVLEMEAITQRNAHADVVAELFPPKEAQP